MQKKTVYTIFLSPFFIFLHFLSSRTDAPSCLTPPTPHNSFMKKKSEKKLKMEFFHFAEQ
jgi:hypothetical protein